jgi:hypothetical protein
MRRVRSGEGNSHGVEKRVGIEVVLADGDRPARLLVVAAQQQERRRRPRPAPRPRRPRPAHHPRLLIPRRGPRILHPPPLPAHRTRKPPTTARPQTTWPQTHDQTMAGPRPPEDDGDGDGDAWITEQPAGR